MRGCVQGLACRRLGRPAARVSMRSHAGRPAARVSMRSHAGRPAARVSMRIHAGRPAARVSPRSHAGRPAAMAVLCPDMQQIHLDIGARNMTQNYEAFQETIGYRFQNPQLLERAMSHSSFANEHRRLKNGNNERLEFLGDAVLELVSSDFLYHTYPQMPEGDMTKLRASLVCEPTLAYCARILNLPDQILLGKGEEQTGGRGRNSIVSDALEALIGAIYLDGGLEPARTFILTHVLNDIDHKKLFYDSKTVLQEIVQNWADREEILYELIGEEGPDHAKRFIVRVRIGEWVFAEGKGSTKKAAEQEAAYHALVELGAE